MRVFAVLSALMAVTFAAPQYDYREPEHIISSTLVPSNGFPLHLQAPSQGRGGEKYLPPAPTTVAPIIRKQFYVISAREDEDSQETTKHLVLGRPQRNYRIIFIKAPQYGAANLKYSAEFAAQEEKTVIYVLTKKDNEVDANDISTPAPAIASKPEVFFIKYKTDEEAQQAQKEIQNEYDKLDGINEVPEESTAEITSVIGSLDGIDSDGSYNYRQLKHVDRGIGKPSASLKSLPSLYK